MIAIRLTYQTQVTSELTGEQAATKSRIVVLEPGQERAVKKIGLRRGPKVVENMINKYAKAQLRKQLPPETHRKLKILNYEPLK